MSVFFSSASPSTIFFGVLVGSHHLLSSLPSVFSLISISLATLLTVGRWPCFSRFVIAASNRNRNEFCSSVNLCHRSAGAGRFLSPRFGRLLKCGETSRRSRDASLAFSATCFAI